MKDDIVARLRDPHLAIDSNEVRVLLADAADALESAARELSAERAARHAAQDELIIRRTAEMLKVGAGIQELPWSAVIDKITEYSREYGQEWPSGEKVIARQMYDIAELAIKACKDIVLGSAARGSHEA